VGLNEWPSIKKGNIWSSKGSQEKRLDSDGEKTYLTLLSLPALMLNGWGVEDAKRLGERIEVLFFQPLRAQSREM